MNKISLRAVFIGGLVDIFASGLFAALLFGVFMVWHDAHSAGDPNRLPLVRAMKESVQMNAAGVLIGIACSVLGGYIAAGQAGHDELLNGAASSALCLLVGILNYSHGSNGGSRVPDVLLVLASPAFGLLGGYLQLVRQRRSAPLRVT